MKRERIPVTVTHADGRAYTLGHVSRVTRAVLSAFMHRAGYDALHANGIACRTFEFIPMPGAVVAQSRSGWTLTLRREATP